MEANELMIGDWVDRFNTLPYYKVIAVDNTTTEVTISQTGNDDDTKRICWNDKLDPIPLTIEILEKNGFVKFIAGQYMLPAGGNEWIVTIIPNLDSAPNSNGTMLIAIKNIYTDAKIAITYVHQLQHALKLCGIDKTIEL